MRTKWTPSFEVRFDVKTDLNTISDKTHNEGLTPPDVPSELIHLGVSTDENVYKIMNEFEQHSSAEISESVSAQTEPM